MSIAQAKAWQDRLPNIDEFCRNDKLNFRRKHTKEKYYE